MSQSTVPPAPPVHDANTIYKATYSGVPIYEFPCRDVAVMRRMADGWVNATHILKVAGFDKPQRTRILEREVQRETHEKVQGGYGKYQGTWVPLDRARDVAAQYDVAKILAPLFDYEPSENSPPPAPKHAANKTKSAARTASAMDGSPSGAAAPKKARKVQSTVKGEKRGRGRPPNNPQPIIPAATVQHPTLPNFDDDMGVLSADSASVSSRSSSPSELMSDHELDELNGYGGGAPGGGDDYNSVAMSMQNRQFLDADMIAAEYSNKLLDYFMAPDDERVPDFLVHPPAGFRINQVIDDEGHTAFHWACSMGILKIIEVLQSIGADIQATNLVGQTPLMRSVMFTNCFDRRTFPRIVEMLKDTIFYADAQRRTILHHIASTTSSRSKLSSTRYYTEIILAKLSEMQPMHDLIAFVNRQDVNGDTALHIASRHQARKLCRVLLSYHASPTIPNSSGVAASEHLSQDPAMKKYLEGEVGQSGAPKSSSSPIRDMDQHHQQQHQQQQQEESGETAQGNGKDEKGKNDSKSTNGKQTLQHPHKMSLPHAAESAIKATQQIAPAISDHLETLANAFDAQLREKDADMEQVQQLLTEMNSDIANTDELIRQQEKLIGQEDLVRQQIADGEEIVNSKRTRLEKLVERTQARDLAQVVQQEECKIDSTMMNNGQETETGEVVELTKQLQALQQERKQLVRNITDLHAKAGVGDKMNDYRRLLATSCGVEIERIDGMLDSIAAALTEGHKDDVEELEAAASEEQAQSATTTSATTTTTTTTNDNMHTNETNSEQVNGTSDKLESNSGSNGNAISV